MNMLQLVQEFCARRSLPIPTGVQSSADAQIRQLQAMLNQLNEDLVTRRAFEQNTRECTFVSIAGEDQGNINTLCPYGYQGILLETVFDRTQRLPLFGGLGPSEWQARKAFNITGPQYQFRIRNNKMLFSPALPVTHTIAFEYLSGYFVADAVTVGTPYKQYWTLDTDTCTLGDQLPLTWLGWKWPAAKGFDYAEEFNAYERMVSSQLSRDNAPTRVDMSGNCNDLRPGIWVPAGNWTVP